MSDNTANTTIGAINVAFKLAELGLAYLEKRQQRRIAITDAGVIDSVDEALREFEDLNVPKAYELPDKMTIDDVSRFSEHELEEGEDVIAAGESEEVEGEPV